MKVAAAKAVIRDLPNLHSGNHILGGYVSNSICLALVIEMQKV